MLKKRNKNNEKLRKKQQEATKSSEQFRNNQDNRDLNGLNMFVSNLKTILASLKNESFLDASLWCEFREIQIQMIHRVISITSKEKESEELLSKLESDSEVIDKITNKIDERWKTDQDQPFIRTVF